MANNSKKYVSLSRLGEFLDNIKTKFAVLGHKHTISDITDYVVDAELSETSTNPVQNKVVNEEFEAIGQAFEAFDLALNNMAGKNHNHDDLYYTQLEVDNKLAAKSDTTHNHDSSYEKKGNIDTAVSTHNTATDAHNDIRLLIGDLNTKVTNFLDVDDETKDELSEVIQLIEDNRGDLESLTTSKVNKTDIVDNLTTASADKVLSANQGVALKSLIDAKPTYTAITDEEIDTICSGTMTTYMASIAAEGVDF